MLTFAIGDIHGCRALLVDLLDQIRREAGRERHRVVCLGDYIDRGPDSAGTVGLLRGREAEAAPGTLICLKGNHEEFVLKSRTDPEAHALWLLNGGVETLASYGTASIDGMPADVLAWLSTRPTFFDDERRCYVHAGLNPAYPRAEQRDADRLWIREPFLGSDHDFGCYVVHGHTPLEDFEPDVRARRVNLDTAAVYGGRLTAGIFSDEQDAPVGFLQSW